MKTSMSRGFSLWTILPFPGLNLSMVLRRKTDSDQSLPGEIDRQRIGTSAFGDDFESLDENLRNVDDDFDGIIDRFPSAGPLNPNEMDPGLPEDVQPRSWTYYRDDQQES